MLTASLKVAHQNRRAYCRSGDSKGTQMGSAIEGRLIHSMTLLAWRWKSAAMTWLD